MIRMLMLVSCFALFGCVSPITFTHLRSVTSASMPSEAVSLDIHITNRGGAFAIAEARLAHDGRPVLMNSDEGILEIDDEPLSLSGAIFSSTLSTTLPPKHGQPRVLSFRSNGEMMEAEIPIGPPLLSRFSTDIEASDSTWLISVEYAGTGDPAVAVRLVAYQPSVDRERVARSAWEPDDGVVELCLHSGNGHGAQSFKSSFVPGSIELVLERSRSELVDFKAFDRVTVQNTVSTKEVAVLPPLSCQSARGTQATVSDPSVQQSDNRMRDE